MRTPSAIRFTRALLAVVTLLAALPAGAESIHFNLKLTHPMLAGGKVRLEPGDYDVTFENAPAGPPHFTAIFSRGGAPVATAPATLKGAPAGTTLSQLADEWLRESLDRNHARKNGAIDAANWEFKVRSTRAFMDALLTSVTFPPSDGDAKSTTPNGPTPGPAATKTPKK